MRTPALAPVAVLVTAASLLGRPADAQQSYPLRCNLRGQALTVWADGFSMRFRGATASWQARPPRVGECAWADRGFRVDEPKVLQWRVEDRPIFGTVQLDSTGTLTQQIYAAGAGDDALDLFNLVMEQWWQRGMLTFQVYRDGNVMKVTRVRRVR